MTLCENAQHKKRRQIKQTEQKKPRVLLIVLDIFFNQQRETKKTPFNLTLLTKLLMSTQ